MASRNINTPIPLPSNPVPVRSLFLAMSSNKDVEHCRGTGSTPSTTVYILFIFSALQRTWTSLNDWEWRCKISYHAQHFCVNVNKCLGSSYGFSLNLMAEATMFWSDTFPHIYLTFFKWTAVTWVLKRDHYYIMYLILHVKKRTQKESLVLQPKSCYNLEEKDNCCFYGYSLNKI